MQDLWRKLNESRDGKPKDHSADLLAALQTDLPADHSANHPADHGHKPTTTSTQREAPISSRKREQAKCPCRIWLWKLEDPIADAMVTEHCAERGKNGGVPIAAQPSSRFHVKRRSMGTKKS